MDSRKAFLIVAISALIIFGLVAYWFIDQNMTHSQPQNLAIDANTPVAIAPSATTTSSIPPEEITSSSPTMNTTGDTARFSEGKIIDLALVVSERGSDCGGGDTCHDFIKMYANLDLDSKNVVGLRIDSMRGLPCVDPKIKTGDMVRVKGEISGVVEDIGIVMSCDDPETRVTKIVPSETLDNVPASILFAENEMEEAYLVVDVLTRNPDWFAGLYTGPSDGKDRSSFYLNKSTELRKIRLTSETKFTHCQQADGAIPPSTEINKEFAAVRGEIISARTNSTWPFGVVRSISVKNGDAVEIRDICVP